MMSGFFFLSIDLFTQNGLRGPDTVYKAIGKDGCGVWGDGTKNGFLSVI
jgi:hypothetical protein